MTFFNSIRASGIDPLVISGGDFLYKLADYKQVDNQLYRTQMEAKAQLIVHAYNLFGYEAAAVGECDLVFGLDSLLKLAAKMKFPLLCANLVREEDGSLIFKPSVIIEKNGFKVGVTSVLMETLSASFMAKIVPGTKVLPPVETLAEEVAKIRDQVDVVFVLAHVNRKNVERITAEIPGVDIVLEPNSFLGNSVIWINEGKHFVQSNDKLLLKIDGQGAHIGRLDIAFKGRGKAWAPSEKATADANLYTGQDISLGPHWGHNPGMAKMMKQYQRNTRRFVETALDTTFKPSEDYLTVEMCGGCHEAQTKFWEGTGHAHAYATLEKSGDEFRYDCMPCHVLGYGETFMNAHEVGRYKNVQCESCHGTNQRHPEDPERFGWKKVDDTKCWGCHNPMETRVRFDPAEAIPKIACPKLERAPK